MHYHSRRENGCPSCCLGYQASRAAGWDPNYPLAPCRPCQAQDETRNAALIAEGDYERLQIAAIVADVEGKPEAKELQARADKALRLARGNG